jgi:23S rRNA (uracil1939-C5)-methyltransferase
VSITPTREKIICIGHRGDGETAAGVYIPFTVPGDVVAVEIEGDRGRLVEILSPGPTRARPPCGHFGTCGGCALQQMNEASYAEWKHDQVVNALSQRGIEGVNIAPMLSFPSRSRRRAVLTARMVNGAVMIGFQERGSHFIVDLEECHTLNPALFSLLAPLRQLLVEILPEQVRTEIDVTLTDTGIDMTVGLPRVTMDTDLRQRLAGFATTLGLARFTVNGELIAQDHPPLIRWAGVGVTPPPGGFLQAVPQAEQAMQDLVILGIGKAKRVADLFSGIGTFTFALARTSSVAAFDSEADSIAALSAALRGAQGLKPVTAERRDLYRRPLLAHELNDFDAVVIDPPRAGAKAQSDQLAASTVKRVIAVSCNPGTFARDARILIDGGYKISRITPIDQFLWSPHIELVANFERS